MVQTLGCGPTVGSPRSSSAPPSLGRGRVVPPPPPPPVFGRCFSGRCIGSSLQITQNFGGEQHTTFRRNVAAVAIYGQHYLFRLARNFILRPSAPETDALPLDVRRIVFERMQKRTSTFYLFWVIAKGRFAGRVHQASGFFFRFKTYLRACLNDNLINKCDVRLYLCSLTLDSSVKLYIYIFFRSSNAKQRMRWQL